MTSDSCKAKNIKTEMTLGGFLTCVCNFIFPEVKRQKSVPEDQKKAEEDRGSPIEVDVRRPFEEEVCSYSL